LWFGWPVVLWLLGPASTLRSGFRHVLWQWFWPLSAISPVSSNPGNYAPGSLVTEASIMPGSLGQRPASILTDGGAI